LIRDESMVGGCWVVKLGSVLFCSVLFCSVLWRWRVVLCVYLGKGIGRSGYL
jgi:hypothetical protein